MILSCHVVPPLDMRLCSSEYTPVCTLSLTCSYTHIEGIPSACNTTWVRQPLAQQDDL